MEQEVERAGVVEVEWKGGFSGGERHASLCLPDHLLRQGRLQEARVRSRGALTTPGQCRGE